MPPSGLGPFNRWCAAKWELTPKSRPFKANKYLNPVSKIRTSEVLIYIIDNRPEMAVTLLKINIFKF
jgi:hypothetical protein